MNVNPKKKLLEGVIFKFNQNDFKGALSDIQNVIKKFPYSELSYNILGSIEMAMNELEKASEAFKKAISLKKDYYHAINNLGLVFYKTVRKVLRNTMPMTTSEHSGMQWNPQIRTVPHIMEPMPLNRSVSLTA